MTMPDFWTIFFSSSVELLGWTLLHFVWQGALVAALLAGTLFLLRDHPPRMRHLLSCVALFGLLMLPVGTALFLSEESPAGAGASIAVVEAIEPASPSQLRSAASTTPPTPTWQERVTAWVQPVLPWIVVGWGVGVIIFSVRLAGGAWRVRRLRRSSDEVRTEWDARLQRLAGQMGLRATVELRRSDRVESPIVAGWWRPVILVPMGLLSGFPPDQVEALLLHELAHVRRHDVLVGRLQAVVETLLFFHPATWWVSRQVRETREACCDALTVEAGAHRTVYARALTALAERALTGGSTAWASAATEGSLLDRIQRLLSPPLAPSRTVRRLSIAAAVLLVVGVPLGLAACASQESTTEPTSQQTAPQATQGGDESSPVEIPSAPDTPPDEAERERVIVVGDDSTKRTVRFEFNDGGEGDGRDRGTVVVHRGETVDTIRFSWPIVERLDNGGLVLRHNGRTDTVMYAHPKIDTIEGGGLLMEHNGEVDTLLRSRPTIDHLENGGIVFQHNGRIDTLDLPDRRNLEKNIRFHLDPDSLKRAVQMPFDPDSLGRALRGRINPDSLARTIQAGINPDSLKRVLRARLNPDSLERVFRGQLHSDSLRRHFEQMRERMERLEEFGDTMDQRETTLQEQLREQARRLREQAGRLEERAEEMEGGTTPSVDTSEAELGAADVPAGKDTYRFVLEDYRARIDGHLVADGGLSVRGDGGYFWVRGPEAVYVFASQPFDGAARVGQFRGRVLNVTIEEHEIVLRSYADRPIYLEDGAPVYASRIPHTTVDGTISETGIAYRLSDIWRSGSPK